MTAAIKAGAYLHHMALSSADPARLAAFYADALDMEASRDGQAWMCEGPRRTLRFIKGENRRLAYAAFACRDAEGLDMVRDHASSRGLEILPSPTPLLSNDAFAVRDCDGNEIAFGLSRQEASRRGLRGPLQHLTLASNDPDAIEAFYVDKLGFVTSDRAQDGDKTLAMWTRSNNEHHTLACFRRSRQGIDHFSFEAGDWSVIKDWCDRMGERRIPIVWGPGRHGPGNNLFIFIADPDGNWIEISAELEVMYDRPLKVWPAEEYTLNMWGKAIYRD